MKTFLCSLFFTLITFYISAEDDPLVMDDLLFHITNNSSNQNITIKMTRISGTNCYDGDFNLTTSFDLETNNGVNSITFANCWKQPNSPAIKFAMGYYKVEIFVTSTDSLLKTFYLDLRSSTAKLLPWQDMNYDYDYGNNILTNYENITVANNSIQTYWNSNPYSEYSPIIQLDATSGNPHLTWDATDTQLGSYSRCGFIIYRAIGNGSYTAISTIAYNTYSYYDYDYARVGNGGTVHYKVSARFFDGETTYRECAKSNEVSVIAVPCNKKKGEVNHSDNYCLSNYPNPFNPSTRIYFTLPETSNLQVVVYNSYGQEIQQLFKGIKEKGNHELLFDGKNLSSGVYYFTVKTDKLSETKKMILIK
jgi:hypothetical protein